MNYFKETNQDFESYPDLNEDEVELSQEESYDNEENSYQEEYDGLDQDEDEDHFEDDL